MSRITILLTMILLTGCGFHLRGSIDLPQHLQTVYITGNDQYGPFVNHLRRAFTSNGATVTANASDAPITIDVLKEKSKKRTIAVSNNFRDTAEYELSYQIEVEIRDQEGFRLLTPTKISSTRIFTNDETQTRAKKREEQQLLKEIQRDVVQQLLRRSQTLKGLGQHANSPRPTASES